MKFFISFLIFFLAAEHCFAQDTANPFQEGIAAYQKGEYETAKELFSSLYQQHPNNPDLMFNLGLSHYHLGQKGLALGLWRKARFLNSGTEPLKQAIAFVEGELGLTSRNENIFATLADWVRVLPTSAWLFLSLLLSLLLGWKIITLFAKRKVPIGDWPAMVFLLIPVWILCFSLSLWLTATEMEITATVIEDGLSTRTGPTESSPTLTGLNEGLLVKILKKHKDWVQVQPPSGSPGWVLKSQVITIEIEN